MLEAIEQHWGEQPATSAVIWLHGLGASGDDFAGVLPELGLLKSLNIRFVFPHAPAIPVTINGGAVMPAWYDITNLDFEKRAEDRPGIQRSASEIEQWIAYLASEGIQSDRVIVAGFSQGGAVALQVGCRYRQKLAGIMALSSYLPLQTDYPEARSAENADTSVFMAHGTEDPVVPSRLGRQSAELLKSQGQPLTWKTYPMPHSVCIEELKAIGKWINICLG